MVTRYAVGALGVGLMGLGAFLAWSQRPWDVVVWLVGAVVLHDGLIAPLVLLVGLGVAATRPGVRGPLRAALLTAGCLTVIALPDILRPGPVVNVTVLPLDYVRNWLVLLGVVVLATVVVLVGKRGRGGHGGRVRRPEPAPVAPKPGPAPVAPQPGPAPVTPSPGPTPTAPKPGPTPPPKTPPSS
ncbi:hypothetical protein [Streptomyces sp. CBMA152]|uniref:hypothetical protein n=1 Tax=Streptomyces sp. CBMA152 TaxID=1896312 RepID=UPI0016600AED|nr:hypothetical protein [Streptomyces sp. CBMA152]MBD0741598.1 hypothetical protein [Streptomyces sp. CBMA152]